MTETKTICSNNIYTRQQHICPTFDGYAIWHTLTPNIKRGEKVKVLHCDGVVITETISDIEDWQNTLIFICESAAVYFHYELFKSQVI